MTAGVRTPPPTVRLLTAEEFAAMPDDGRRTELVDGRVRDVPPPQKVHGVVCSSIVFALELYIRPRQLGRSACNDTGVQTRRGPDTVRGADVCYFSYERMPARTIPDGYDTVPDLVFEVKSPSDRTRATLDKVAEYHAAGVLVVCLVDPDARTVEVHPRDGQPRTHGPDDTLSLPELFPDFSVPVRALVG